MIQEASSDAERAEVQRFFSKHFDHIKPNAVPMSEVDHIYAPLILRVVDDETGELLGASLTCRAYKAVASVMSLQMTGRDPLGLSGLLDKHRELDLMAVRPDARGRGIGAQLIEEMAARLRLQGVRVLFGNATTDLDLDALERFYSRSGFFVVERGKPLPPLLGKDWTMPNVEPPAFYFWRRL